MIILAHVSPSNSKEISTHSQFASHKIIECVVRAVIHCALGASIPFQRVQSKREEIQLNLKTINRSKNLWTQLESVRN